MPLNLTIEGHAIVTVDGMIAAADGNMPPRLRNDADWRLFQAALDTAVLVVLGRHGHQRHPNPGRRRLVATSTVTALAVDPADAQATLWNPATQDFAAAMAKLGIVAGTVAITGGTSVFDTFLPLYTSFVLVEVPRLILPGGTPCFSSGHPRLVLAEAGLVPGGPELIDANAGIALTRWTH
ncbi:MAG: dihydrofolate reductase [Devosia sp.]|nr:dihydrofolate reductase [Devosia sp.]